MSASQAPIRLSVVFAVPDGSHDASICLQAIRQQVSEIEGEVVVVDGSGTDFRSRCAHPGNFQWVSLSPRTETPVLWQAGIEIARGTNIVLLVESCVPESDWVDRIMETAQSDAAVRGGAIEPAPNLSLLNSAVYFCRYSRYMPASETREIDDLPGTNCVYRRSSLDGLQYASSDGFWETFVHREMCQRGLHLFFEPSIRVRFVGQSDGLSFLRVRFAHGRKFAARRAADLNWTKRVVRSAAFPIVPALMLRRIAAQVWAKREFRGRFLISSPLLVAFLLAWSAGECLGYLLGSPKRAGATAPQCKPARNLP